VAGIVGLGKAMELAAADLDEESSRLLQLRDKLRAKVITGPVMVCGSRKVAAGCVGMRNGCSVGHYRLLT